MMVGRLLSYWYGIFSGAFAVKLPGGKQTNSSGKTTSTTHH